MAQIKIYAEREHLSRHRAALSDAVHQAAMTALGLPEDKRFHRFIALDPEDFVRPADRGPGYTVIEVSMFEGRSGDAKRALLRALMDGVPAVTGVAVDDVEITITETPQANWGIRGVVADELSLTYKVGV